MSSTFEKIDKQVTIRKKLEAGTGSPLKAYKDLTVGQSSTLFFLAYELLNFFFSSMAGGAGFLLRRKLYSRLFKKVGRGLIIGRNVVIRHPQNITFGDNVTIDDNCVIDARGAGEQGIIFEDNVIINRNCSVLAKAGPIRIGAQTGLGSNSVIVSTAGVDIGEAVLIAGGCYFSAGAYHISDTHRRMMDQGNYSKGPITVANDVWIGTGVILLDGVTVGTGAVIDAGAVVNKDVAERAIIGGVPAKIVQFRE